MYLAPGLFAEGSSDYEFLPALLDRLLPAITASLFPGSDVSSTLLLRPPLGTKGSRAEKIAAAVRDKLEQFQLLIVHSDGKSRPEQIRKQEVEPGFAAVAQLEADWPIIPVACLPVWEIEAWMLTDPSAFRSQYGIEAPSLPKDPERDSDPKATFNRILKEARVRNRGESPHALFGRNVDLGTLDALPAFRAFKVELTEGIRSVARSQGIHRA
jgi:hypothetical protein